MRVPILVSGLAAVLACNGGTVDDSGSPFRIPTAIVCADNATLRQQAADDRGRSDAATSDQQKILLVSRANFVASLALIAELNCRGIRPADDALKSVLDAARSADSAKSFYERARHWSEASLMATQLVQTLIQQLPAPTDHGSL